MEEVLTMIPGAKVTQLPRRENYPPVTRTVKVLTKERPPTQTKRQTQSQSLATTKSRGLTVTRSSMTWSRQRCPEDWQAPYGLTIKDSAPTLRSNWPTWLTRRLSAKVSVWDKCVKWGSIEALSNRGTLDNCVIIWVWNLLRCIIEVGWWISVLNNKSLGSQVVFRTERYCDA